MLTYRQQELEEHSRPLIACDMFILAIEEFIMLPVIKQAQRDSHGVTSRLVQSELEIFNTNHLESVFVMVCLLQD